MSSSWLRQLQDLGGTKSHIAWITCSVVQVCRFSSIFEQKLHSFFTEFETSQHEQAIQNELDKIQGTHINGSNHLTSPTSLAVAAYEREIEEKEREIEDFERVVADVGSRKEKVQRQLQLNRDNIER